MLGAVVGVIGTLQATEVLKEMLGIGETLAGRLLIYDARATRFSEIKVAWDPDNPLSGSSADHPRPVDPCRRRATARCARPDRGRWRGRAVTIRGILFDKDGTLLDYWHTWVPINRRGGAVCRRAAMSGWRPSCCARDGQDPETGARPAGTVLAAGSIDEIADAFAAHLGERTPRDLARRRRAPVHARAGRSTPC